MKRLKLRPSSLVPIVKGARQLILVGDHRQLPPTVTSRSAEEGGLNIPLFERLLANGISAHMLTTQYRMHPTIREFPSARFYENRLEDGCSSSERPPVAGFVADWDRPVSFVPVHGAEIEGGVLRGQTWMRSIVIKIVNDLLVPGDLMPRISALFRRMRDRLGHS